MWGLFFCIMHNEVDCAPEYRDAYSLEEQIYWFENTMDFVEI